MQWHQLDHMQTICTSLQTDSHTDTLSLNFYRPHALPDAQLAVSKHWWQQYIDNSSWQQEAQLSPCQSSEGSLTARSNSGILSLTVCAAISLAFTRHKFLHRPASQYRTCHQPISRQRGLRQRQPMRGRRGRGLVGRWCEWTHRAGRRWPMTMKMRMSCATVIGWTGFTCWHGCCCCCAFSISTRHSTGSSPQPSSSPSSTCQYYIHSSLKVKYTDIAVRSLTCHITMGTHMPYRITQCYLPPEEVTFPPLLSVNY